MYDDDNELNKILNSKPKGSPPGNPACSRGAQNSLYGIDGDIEKDKQFTKCYCQWNSSDGKIFVPANKTVQTLPPGVYEVDISPNIGLFFEKIPVKTENLLRFPDTNSDVVVEEIQTFWDREELFGTYELIYKRGILLWGPAGSGKSCTVQLIMEDVVNRGGVVLKFDQPDIFIDGMRALRLIQPASPVVVIMEDIDSIIEEYSESEVLNILDGVNEIEKVVFLATTNYPEKLGKRIVNRPSRFDKRFKIGAPNAASRKMYFEYLCRDKTAEELKIDLDEWVEDTEDMSIAHLKELFVAVVILGDPYSRAIKTLRNMTERIDANEDEEGFGFQTHVNQK